MIEKKTAFIILKSLPKERKALVKNDILLTKAVINTQSAKDEYKNKDKKV